MTIVEISIFATDMLKYMKITPCGQR